MNIDTFLFVYAKTGKIRCLTTDQAVKTNVLKHGWKHTATINTVRWIEALVNGNNAEELVNELKGQSND